MGHQSVDSDLIRVIAGKLSEAGIDVEKAEDSAWADTARETLAEIFEFYRRNYFSRDGWSTADEVAKKLHEIGNHLNDVRKLVATDFALQLELKRFVPKQMSFIRGGEFLTSISFCLDAVQSAEDSQPSAYIVDFGDGAVEHRRKTRTHARDILLIPAILGWLGRMGMRLRDDTQKWDMQSLDCACEIIEVVLKSRGIAVPDAGDTAHGEARQGRLRRTVKKAWDARVVPLLTSLPGDSGP